MARALTNYIPSCEMCIRGRMWILVESSFDNTINNPILLSTPYRAESSIIIRFVHHT